VVSLFQTDRPVRAPRNAQAAASAGVVPAPSAPTMAGKVTSWKRGHDHFTLISDLSDDLVGQISSRLGASSKPHRR
jgi:hypothetical protein